MYNTSMKQVPKILGLDISTKTIGFALFDYTNSELLELTHFSPKILPKPTNKNEELLRKSDAFRKHLEYYRNINIDKIVIEEPLLTSNNIYTVGTLLRYNSMIMKCCYDTLNIVPEFISTYNARRFAFPNLVNKNQTGKEVLFGGYPKDIDKKQIIWEHVNTLFPEIEWQYDKKGKLKKENYDMSDSVCCVIGYLNMTMR